MRVGFALLLAVVLSLGAAAPVARALTLVSHTFTVEPATNSVRFELTLSGVPDFLILDAASRPRDEFQFWITYDPARMNQASGTPDVLIRSGEIPWTGQIVVRAGSPHGNDPHSGGWGPVRGMVPFTVVGSTVSFSVPLATLGDADGVFGYFLGVLQWGGFTSTVVSRWPNPVAAAPSTWGRLKSLYR